MTVICAGVGYRFSTLVDFVRVNISPVLLVKARRVQGDGVFEHRHLTFGDLDIQRGVCVNERLDQLCGGAHLLLRKEKTSSSKHLFIQKMPPCFSN